MYINIKNINKFYYSTDCNTEALSNINLSIDNGDEIVIVGESGAGKSTLLNILGFIDSDYSGEYFIDEKNIRS